MNTIILQVDKQEFTDIKSGIKKFVVLKSKVPPQTTQRLLLVEEGLTGNEIDSRVTLVHSEPGLMKDYFIISFNGIEKETES